MASQQKCLIWLGLIFSLLSSVINGIDMSFNVYANTLKETFNFSQTQVEITASMGTVGMGLLFLEVIMTTMFGYNITFLVTWVTVPLAFGLYALAATYNHFFQRTPAFVFFVQLLLSTSNGMASMVIYRVNVEIFPREHSGKIIGLLTAFNCMAKIAFAVLLGHFFPRNLKGFFLALGIASAVLFGVTYILLYRSLSKKDNWIQKEHTSACYQTVPDECQTTNSAQELATESTLKELICSAFFHLTFWPSTIFYGCTYTILNNITSIADSIKFEKPLTSVYVISAVIFVVRLTSGTIFDKFMSLTCGVILSISCSFCFLAAMVLGMISLDIFCGYIFIVLAGIAMGAGMTNAVSTLVLRFGRHQFGVIFVMFYLVAAFAQLFVQLLLGYFYDSEIAKRGLKGNFCEGKDCFFGTFFSMLIISSVVIIVQLFNLGRAFMCPPNVSIDDYNAEKNPD